MFVRSRCDFASRGDWAPEGARLVEANVRFFLGTMPWNLSDARGAGNMRIVAIFSGKRCDYEHLRIAGGIPKAVDFAWAFLAQLGQGHEHPHATRPRRSGELSR